MNIVLLIGDSLRIKDIENQDIEFLTELDHEGVYKHYSNSPWTVPAHASIFTSNLPSEHGTNTSSLMFEQENQLVEDFKSEGFFTAGISENTLFSDATGLSNGFDKFISMNKEEWSGEIWQELLDAENLTLIDKVPSLARAVIRRDLGTLKSALRYYYREKFYNEDYNPTYTGFTIQKSLDLLEKYDDVFLTINLMPTHLPYTFNQKQKQEYLPNTSSHQIDKLTSEGSAYVYDLELTDKEKKIRRDAYKASISYLESKIYDLIDKSPEETYFVVLGDHGELLGERTLDGHNLYGHHFGTFDELIEVPILVYPKVEEVDLQSLSDHTQVNKLLLSIARNKSYSSSMNSVRSEYYGKDGLNEFLGLDSPPKPLFQRKSFSILNDRVKYEVATEGSYSYLRSDDDADILEDFKRKANIYYSWIIDN
jgi:arylsulfatase A-like enzyme